MPKPANGRYHLVADGGRPDMKIDVDDTGADATFGRFTWDAVNELFAHAKVQVAIECTGTGRFKAIVRPGQPDEEFYEGDCSLVP